MRTIASEVAVHSGPEIVPTQTSKGWCAVAFTGNPFAQQPVGIYCYAVLGSWLPVDEPVGMFVTFIHAGETTTHPAYREVNTVYASPHFRGLAGDTSRTPAVVVGCWLFQTSALTRHSVDRTDAGDRWATQVGGDVPPRDQQGTAQAAERTGAMALARLNEIDWSDWQWRAEP
jgi:hypothetical protein